MNGNPENAKVWAHADVLVSFEDNPAIPASLANDFGEDWEYVGLLNGTDGFPETASSTNTKHTAWGFGVIEETERDHELMRSFKTREVNEVVHQLMYPGSEGGDLKFGPAAQAFIAFVTYKGEDEQRYISRRKCLIRRDGATTVNEDNLEETGFMVTILPDEDGFHWHFQSSVFTPGS